MDSKDNFFACLTDSQLGFYYAHEYDENLSELLQDELKMKQYILCEKWKEHEKTVANEKGQQSLVLSNLTDNMNKVMNMMGKLSTRIENMETKMEEILNLKVIDSENYQPSEASMNLSNHVSKLTEVLEIVSTKINCLEEKIEQGTVKMNSIDRKLENNINTIKQENGRNTAILTTFMDRTAASQTEYSDKINKLEQSISEKNVKMKQCIKDSEKAIMKKMNDTVQNVDLFKSKEWMLLKENVDDITINTCKIVINSMDSQSANEWLAETSKAVLKYKKEYIRPSLVNTVIAILKKFEDNEEIQNDRCLFYMILYSESTVHYISNNMEAIEHLMKIISKRDGYYCNHYVFDVLSRIAECKETRQKLMKYEYLTIFLNALASTTEGSAFGLLSSLILANLLDLPESEFPQEIKKEDIENKILTIYEEILAKLYIYTWNPRRHCSWYLDRIITGTKTQKYVCAYAIYNGTYRDTRTTYIVAGVIPVLEKVISDHSTDSIVKKIASEALAEYKQ